MAIILSYLKEIAKQYIGRNKRMCYFYTWITYGWTKKRNKRYCKNCWITTAISMVYGSTQNELNTIIIGIGAGYCNVSLLCIQDGIFEVKAFYGNNWGENNIDDELIKFS